MSIPNRPGLGPIPPGNPPWGRQADEGRLTPGQLEWELPEAKVNELAAVGFLMGLFALVPGAVTLGIMALVEIRRVRQRGQWLAISALVLSAAWTAVGLVVVADSLSSLSSYTAPPTGGPVAEPDPVVTAPPLPGQTTPTPPPAVPQPAHVPISALKVGDCLGPSDQPDPSTAEVESCSQLHGAEVFAKVETPPAGSADEAAAQAEGRSACLKATYSIYHDPVLLPIQTTTLPYPATTAVAYLAPQASAPRTVICTITYPQLTTGPLPSPRPARAYTAIQQRFLALEEAARVPAEVFVGLRFQPPWRTDQIYSQRAAAAEQTEVDWLRSGAVGPAAQADAKALAADDLIELTWWAHFTSARTSAEFTMFQSEADPAAQMDNDIAQLRSDLGLPMRPPPA